MRYVAQRSLTIMGRVYEPGDTIEPGDVPPRVLANLVNLRRVLQSGDKAVKPVAVATATAPVPEGQGRGRLVKPAKARTGKR
jgi:hypothetical protein